MAGPEFSVEIEGLDQLRRKLRTLADLTPALRAALYVEGEQLMTDAKRLTPVDEGVLRASGHVQLPIDVDGGVEVTVGFGGPAGSGNQGETNDEGVGYAVHVHEDLLARHTVGQAKYLEAPFVQRRAGLAARIFERVWRRVKEA